MLRAHAPVLTAVLVLLVACEPPPAPAPGIDAATLNVLLQRLDRVAAAFENSSRATPAGAGAPESPGERTSAGGDVAALQARVGALEAELAVLRAQPAGNSAPRSPVLGAAPAVRTASVQGLKELMTRDEAQSTNEALRSVFLLGPAQVLERFGTPSYVTVQGNGGCRWGYEGEREIGFVFAQGVVVGID